MSRSLLISSAVYTGALLAAIFASLGVIYISLASKKGRKPFPTANEAGHGVSELDVRQRFLANAQDVIKDASRKYHDVPFYLIDQDGARRLFLPPVLVAKFKTDARLSSREFFKMSLKTDFPGFEGVRPMTSEDGAFIATIRSQLTPLLRTMIGEIAVETEYALVDLWTSAQDWHEIHVRESILQLVARMSSRVFLGPQASRNPEWLALSIQYTLDVFNGARALCKYPDWLARIVCLYQKDCMRLRKRMKRAREVLDAVLATEATQTGGGEVSESGPGTPLRHALAATSRDKWHDVEFQLNLSVAAIHTTTDLIHQTLLDIAAHPSIIEDLRTEIGMAVDHAGWTYQSIQMMDLLDSVMKETQRLKPVNLGTFVRYVREDVKLSTETAGGYSSGVIPKGTFVTGAMSQMWDSDYYENPGTWDGYRFLRLRRNCGTSKGQAGLLVASSEAHMGFGFGTHTCPGRFFAADEAKIILGQILLNYDFQLIAEVADSTYKPIRLGLEMLANPEARLVARRRATS